MRSSLRSTRTIVAIVLVSATVSCSSGGDATVDGTVAGLTVDATAPATAQATDLVIDAPAGPEGGSCVVSSVGDVSISFSSQGGPSTVSSDYWLPAGVESPLEPIALLVTCNGVDGTVVSFSAASDELDFAPGTYELTTDQVGIFLPDAILQPTAPVPIQLTTFDSTRITGSMTFDAAGSNGVTSNFRIDFDLANPTPG